MIKFYRSVYTGFHLYKNKYILPEPPIRPHFAFKTYLFDMWKNQLHLSHQECVLKHRGLEKWEELDLRNRHRKLLQDYQVLNEAWKQRYLSQGFMLFHIFLRKRVYEKYKSELDLIPFSERMGKVAELIKFENAKMSPEEAERLRLEYRALKEEH